MGKMQQFKREIRSSNGRQFAFELKNGYGAVLGGLFERVARGKVHDSEIREMYGFSDDDGEPAQVKFAAGPQLTPSAKAGKYTALVSLHGVALYDLEYQPYCFSTLLFSQIMESLANDPSVDQIVLDINTPGGHVTGTQEAADAVWLARKKKPVIGIVNALCASAGYWIGSQCTKLIGVPSADVGSIGVFMCHYDCSAMLADAGIKPTFIFAGEHKTEGNSMEPLGDEAKAWFQSEVDATYQDFLAAVARGRSMTAEDVREKFGKGRCYGAPMAKKVGMIDEIASIKLALSGVGLSMAPPQDGRRRIEAEPVDKAGGQDAPTEASETEPELATAIVMTDKGCGQIIVQIREKDGAQASFVTAAWPEKVKFAAGLFDGGVIDKNIALVGTTITIAVENGAAVYTQIGITEAGDWICALAPNSSFTPIEPVLDDAAEAQKTRTAAVAARRRRIALHEAA